MRYINLYFTYLLTYLLPVAKNHNFWQFMTFGGLLYRPPFTDEGQIGVLEQTQGLLTRQISSECVHCVGIGWPKTAILGKF